MLPGGLGGYALISSPRHFFATAAAGGDGASWAPHGGSEFIGSHLCERLLADGHEILCVDSFSIPGPSVWTGRALQAEK